MIEHEFELRLEKINLERLDELIKAEYPDLVGLSYDGETLSVLREGDVDKTVINTIISTYKPDELSTREIEAIAKEESWGRVDLKNDSLEGLIERIKRLEDIIGEMKNG